MANARRLVATLVLALGIFGLPTPASAGGPLDATVGTEVDYLQALATASTSIGGTHTIVLDENIDLAGSTDPSYTGTEDLVLDGQGQYTLNGMDNSRVLDGSSSTGALTLRAIGIIGGRADGDGGAINWDEDVTVHSSSIGKNRATGAGDQRGGAIFTLSQVLVSDSLFELNSAEATGRETM